MTIECGQNIHREQGGGGGDGEEEEESVLLLNPTCQKHGTKHLCTAPPTSLFGNVLVCTQVAFLLLSGTHYQEFLIGIVARMDHNQKSI